MVGTAVLAVWVLTAQNPVNPVITEGLKALGSENLKTLQFSGAGAEFCLGQQYNAALGWPKFNLGDYSRLIDFESGASRQIAKRSQGEPGKGGCGQPVGETNQQTFIAPNADWATKLEITLTPQGFLKAAAAHNATVTAKKGKGVAYDVVTFSDGKYKMNGYLRADNHRVERVETWLDNPLMGDMLVEAAFTDYKDFGGLKFPGRLVQSRGGYPVLELTIADAKANVPGNLQPPAPKGGGKGGAAKKGPAAPPATQWQKLGDGVYLMTGAYQTVVVEFKDYVAIWEAPTIERAAEAIEAVKKNIPGKPVKYEILSHNHNDHSNGLPVFVAEGATIVTHKNNKAFLVESLSAPRTLPENDAMAKSGRQPKFELMGDRKVIKDSTQVVELHLVKGNIHDDGNIVMYLPKLKMLVNSDVFNYTAPGPTVHPWHANLWENLERLKLDVDRIIPTHAPPQNRVVTFADLRAAVQK
jgi:glyoxylase-like metal-dependent hydrolase (beta-lactamase superfamily II)